MANRNGNGVTLGNNTRITVGLLGLLATFAFAAITGWATVWAQSSYALPRTEAYREFVCKDDFLRAQGDLSKQIEKLDGKLEKLLERSG